MNILWMVGALLCVAITGGIRKFFTRDYSEMKQIFPDSYDEWTSKVAKIEAADLGSVHRFSDHDYDGSGGRSGADEDEFDYLHQQGVYTDQH